MKVGVYCVKDAKQGFLSPTFESYDSIAIRGFAYAIKTNGLMNFATEDYDLYRIGDFDTETGLTALDPVLLVHGTEVKE